MGQEISWEEFVEDYNARFPVPGVYRTEGSLKLEKTRLQNKGQFELSYWRVRGQA